MTRSFRYHVVLLLLLAACARRERPFVPGAGPPDAGASRLIMKADGTFEAVRGSKSILLDAPGRLRLRELSRVFAFARDGGIVEIDALVDAESGPGAVPLRISKEGSFGYYEKLQFRQLWQGGERAPAAMARPGFEGAWKLLRIGTVGSIGVIGEPLYPEAEPLAPLENADFVLLWTEPEDVYQDVVLSLVALERRFPGKVVLRPPK